MFTAEATSFLSDAVAGVTYLPKVFLVWYVDGSTRDGPDSSQVQHPVFIFVSGKVEFLELR
jgi:hypothetical protein